jgi:hypothetical protein
MGAEASTESRAGATVELFGGHRERKGAPRLWAKITGSRDIARIREAERVKSKPLPLRIRATRAPLPPSVPTTRRGGLFSAVAHARDSKRRQCSSFWRLLDATPAFRVPMRATQDPSSRMALHTTIGKCKPLTRSIWTRARFQGAGVCPAVKSFTSPSFNVSRLQGFVKQGFRGFGSFKGFGGDRNPRFQGFKVSRCRRFRTIPDHPMLPVLSCHPPAKGFYLLCRSTSLRRSHEHTNVSGCEVHGGDP